MRIYLSLYVFSVFCLVFNLLIARDIPNVFFYIMAINHYYYYYYLKPIPPQKPLSLKNLRNFQNIKPVAGTKYYLEYDGKRFNIKPIPPPKPLPPPVDHGGSEITYEYPPVIDYSLTPEAGTLAEQGWDINDEVFIPIRCRTISKLPIPGDSNRVYYIVSTDDLWIWSSTTNSYSPIRKSNYFLIKEHVKSSSRVFEIHNESRDVIRIHKSLTREDIQAMHDYGFFIRSPGFAINSIAAKPNDVTFYLGIESDLNPTTSTVYQEIGCYFRYFIGDDGRYTFSRNFTDVDGTSTERQYFDYLTGGWFTFSMELPGTEETDQWGIGDSYLNEKFREDTRIANGTGRKIQNGFEIQNWKIFCYY